MMRAKPFDYERDDPKEDIVQIATRIVGEWMGEGRKALEREGHRSSSYSVGKIEDLAQLRAIFTPADGDAVCWELNWCFFGTSGVHGSFGGIDDLFGEYCEDPDVDHLTVLVVQPRIVRMYYGNIEVRRADVPWLRELAANTRAGVADSQSDSWPKRKRAKKK